MAQTVAQSISLTGIYVQDPHDKGFTAFFAELPNIVAEGDTEDEATKNLFSLVQVVFEHQKNEMKDPGCFNDQVKTKEFNLSYAIAWREPILGTGS